MAKDKHAHAELTIGSPEKIINTLVKAGPERTWALDKIILEGPPHKQLQHTLVLKRLEKLASLYKKNNGISLKSIKGKKIISSGPEHETTFPVDLPAQSLEGTEDPAQLIEHLSKGPEHEVLYTLLLLQAIECMISAESSK